MIFFFFGITSDINTVMWAHITHLNRNCWKKLIIKCFVTLGRKNKIENVVRLTFRKNYRFSFIYLQTTNKILFNIIILGIHNSSKLTPAETYTDINWKI